jgi:hypothetical protein
MVSTGCGQVSYQPGRGPTTRRLHQSCHSSPTGPGEVIPLLARLLLQEPPAYATIPLRGVKVCAVQPPAVVVPAGGLHFPAGCGMMPEPSHESDMNTLTPEAKFAVFVIVAVCAIVLFSIGVSLHAW